MPDGVGSKPALRSAPEENARPAPVITTARTSSSSGGGLDGGPQVQAELLVPGVHRLGAVQRDAQLAAAPLAPARSRNPWGAILRAMDPAFVFGYGSLLERGAGRPCRLAGHRRRWGVAMDNRRTIPGYKYFLDPRRAPGPRCTWPSSTSCRSAGAASTAWRSRSTQRPGDARRARAQLPPRRRDGAGRRGPRRPVWAYLGLEEARERFAGGGGTAVVSRAYVEACGRGSRRTAGFDTSRGAGAGSDARAGPGA